MTSRLVFAAIVTASVVGACEVASDYSPVMSSFSDATDKAYKALESYDKAASARLTARHRDMAVLKPVGVRVVEGDCTTSSARCRVVYLSRLGDPAPQELTIGSIAPQHLLAMREITLYAKALKDLAAADAAASVKAAVDKAAAATTGLATLVMPAAAPAVAAFAVPVSKAAVWFFGKYQEEVKLDALRHAVTQMQPAMRECVAKFGAVAGLYATVEEQRLVKELDQAFARFEESRSREDLDALLAAAERLDTVLAATPKTVFNQLGDAHTQLAEALNNPSVSFETVFTKINRLAADAETLYAVAEELRKASSAKTQ